MKLGILVTTDKFLEQIVGITRSAVSKGHEVIIFNMDDGTKLIDKPPFLSLCGTSGVSMSFCDYGAKKLNVPTEGIPDDMVCGSQFDNAIMVHKADKVIVV